MVFLILYTEIVFWIQYWQLIFIKHFRYLSYVKQMYSKSFNLNNVNETIISVSRMRNLKAGRLCYLLKITQLGNIAEIYINISIKFYIVLSSMQLLICSRVEGSLIDCMRLQGWKLTFWVHNLSQLLTMSYFPSSLHVTENRWAGLPSSMRYNTIVEAQLSELTRAQRCSGMH